jgi:hypothetical protein
MDLLNNYKFTKFTCLSVKIENGTTSIEIPDSEWNKLHSSDSDKN